MGKETTIRWADLSPVCLIRRVLRDLPSILAVGLIAALLTAAIMQISYKPQYSASATVAVNVKNASYSALYSNLTTTSEIANTFTGLFGSEVFRDLSANRPGSEQLSGKLEASVVPETNILQLKVTAEDPISAFRTLRFWLDNYDTVSQHVFQNVVLRELDAPSVPRAPSNPLHLGSAAKRAFLIGAAGMVLALLAILTLAVFAARSCRVSRSAFPTIAACAAGSLLVVQTGRNVFGAMDLLPLTGVTFPFLSNGGSAMMASWGLLAFLKATDTREGASFAIRRVKNGKKEASGHEED